MSLGPAELAAVNAALQAACEEMGAALRRSAFSPNIKERRDFSCALFDAQARLVAQAEHIPVHLGSMEASVQAVLDELPSLERGDAAITNDPYRGGTHVPDVTMVVPVFAGSKLLGYAAARAHHADMGGIAPGSMPAGATEVQQEGLVIPPALLHRGGRPVRALFDLIARNTRTPDERRADLEAQRAACALGAARAGEAAERWGAPGLQRAMQGLLGHSRAWLERELAAIPPGPWEAEDALDDDGVTDEPVPLRVRVARRGKRLDIDFEGSSPQRRGNVNAPLAVTRSACYYVVKLLTSPDIPSNHGLFEPVRVRAPAGSVLNPRSPAAVSAGNVETSQRVVDLLLAALAPALPERVPAMSQGTMNNVAMGSVAGAARPWAYYETLAGGEGACPWRDGMSGVHTHMTNTLNTPIEALEHSYPLRVRRYTLRRGTGGAGRFRGGDGLAREVELLEPTVVSLLTERRRSAPRGLAGGSDGESGRNSVLVDGDERPLPSKATLTLPKGAVVRTETPGGGGWGAP